MQTKICILSYPVKQNERVVMVVSWCGGLLQSSNMLSGAVLLPVAYEVTVQNDNVDVRLSEESSDSAPGSPAFHGIGNR